MIDLRRPGHLLVLSGALISMLSAFLPWIEARTELAKFSIVPASAAVIRASVWVVLVVLAIGVVLLVIRGSVAVVGSGLAVLFHISIAYWFVASRVTWLIPDQLLPDDAPARLGQGGTLAMTGTVIGLVGCVVVLVEDTWNLPPIRLAAWVLPVALVLAAACFGIRHAAWLNVAGGSFAWSIGFDAVPFVGDVLSLTLFVCSVLLVVSIIRPNRSAAIAIAAGGLVVTIVSMVAAAFNSIATRGAEAMVSRIGALDGVEVNLHPTRAPLATATLGVVLLGFAVVLWRVSGRRAVEATESAVGTYSPFGKFDGPPL